MSFLIRKHCIYDVPPHDDKYLLDIQPTNEKDRSKTTYKEKLRITISKKRNQGLNAAKETNDTRYRDSYGIFGRFLGPIALSA